MDEEIIIPWEKIKNGHQGFEKLANEFVVKEIGFDANWKPSKLTRDGNKDGYAILYCYSPVSGTREEQIWMEAKYSLKQKKLSRYKLDSTIVSAIIEGNIRDIIFITNIEIDTSVEQTIRTALINALSFQENNVAFFSKWSLERWLLLHPEIYSNYFGGKPTIPPNYFETILCSDKLKIFQKTKRLRSFTEPLKELSLKTIYSSYLRIFSPITQVVIIKSVTGHLEIKNNRFVIDNRIELSEGINAIELDIEFVKPTTISGVALKIGDELELQFNNQIEITERVREPLISISAQTDTYEELTKSLTQCYSNSGFHFHAISGNGGMGKTFLFDKFLKSDLLDKKDVIASAFTEDQFENSKLLLDIALSVLFYYLDISDIDPLFLRELKKDKIFISSFLEKLVSARAESGQLYKESKMYEAHENILFPTHASLNFKVILLDDIHKLDDSNRLFLCKMLMELYQSSISGFVILSGRHQFFDSPEFLFMKSKCVILYHEIDISTEDIINSIKRNGFPVPELPARMLFNQHPFNCLLLIALIRYIFTSDNEVDNASIILLYQEFLATNSFEKSVLTGFQKVGSNKNKQAVLNAVYMSSAGINPHSLKPDHQREVRDLIDLELIRHNPDGHLIPYHDLYLNIYQDHFQHDFLQWFPENKYLFSEMEELRYLLQATFTQNVSSIEQILRKVIELRKNYNFHSIIYILEPVFRNRPGKNIKNRLGEVAFYKLYFHYAYALAHTSRFLSGLNEKKLIANETYHSSNDELRLVCAEALAEVVNDSFEHLQISQINEYSTQLTNLLENLFKDGYIDENRVEFNPSFILNTEIQMLKEMSIGNYSKGELHFSNLIEICTVKGSAHRLAIIKIRFARTIYHQNQLRAMHLLEEAIETRRTHHKGPGYDKWEAIGTFEYIFLKICLGEGHMKDLKEAQEKLRVDLFNDYRRSMNSVASIYLVKNQPERAYEVFSKEAEILREANNRYLAIRFQLLAAYEYLNRNSEKAEEYLKNQAQRIEALGPNYTEVINHNLSVLRRENTESNTIQFMFKENLKPDTFYIDPRLW